MPKTPLITPSMPVNACLISKPSLENSEVHPNILISSQTFQKPGGFFQQSREKNDLRLYKQNQRFNKLFQMGMKIQPNKKPLLTPEQIKNGHRLFMHERAEKLDLNPAYFGRLRQLSAQEIAQGEKQGYEHFHPKKTECHDKKCSLFQRVLIGVVHKSEHGEQEKCPGAACALIKEFSY